MSRLNFDNLQVEPVELDIKVGAADIKNNMSDFFTTIPIYEVIIFVTLLIIATNYVQKMTNSISVWTPLAITSTLTSIFTFTMIYAELFSSYITFGISMFIWVLSIVMVKSSKK